MYSPASPDWKNVRLLSSAALIKQSADQRFWGGRHSTEDKSNAAAEPTFFLLTKVNKSAFQKQTFKHLRSAPIAEDSIDI